ncbi:MAG TPA: radical SAM protein [Bryobacteraceae bacterium]|nr:radical SAM protein [Bryobacteraceae bacterium]
MTTLVQIHTPQPAAHHFRFSSAQGEHVFLVDGSQIYDIGDDFAFAPPRPPMFPMVVPSPPPLHSLSLHLGQSCNLHCGYCYADGGAFGGTGGSPMDETTARKSVDLLLREAESGTVPVLGFLGGEPLLHRGLLHSTVHYAAAEAARSGKSIRFSLTTNGTLLTEEDALLFSEYDWTVQISVDGMAALHDRQRPAKNGGSSHAALLGALERMEKAGRPRALTARSTIARGWGRLPEELDYLLSLGFDDAGFSPVLAADGDGFALTRDDLARFLNEMTECGERAVAHWREGRAYPFANLQTALRQLHQGHHQPYPCGAGAGYLSASTSGRLYACHRFVNDAKRAMGSITSGPEDRRRRQFLEERHVDQQQPCGGCWARYLCGGSCHHEALRAGRHACDYIRGWLAFCLRVYVEMETPA